MTIASEAHYAEANWTGVETSFTPGFTTEAASHVTVKYVDSDDALQPLTQGTHYTVTLAADGAVTVVPVALPAASPGAPVTLVFKRVTPALQGVNFANLARYDAATHQTLHDRAMRIAAELRGEIARSPTPVFTDDYVDFRPRRIKAAEAEADEELVTRAQMLELTDLAAIAASVTAAQLAETNAETAETNAEAAETGAAAARDTAELWAEQTEDTPVETGPNKYSAKHWSAKANAAAALILPLLSNLDYGFVSDAPTETRDYGSVLP